MFCPPRRPPVAANPSTKVKLQIAIQAVTEVMPATTSYDRSDLASRQTKFMTDGMTAIIAVWRTIFRRLLGSRNPFVVVHNRHLETVLRSLNALELPDLNVL